MYTPLGCKSSIFNCSYNSINEYLDRSQRYYNESKQYPYLILASCLRSMDLYEGIRIYEMGSLDHLNHSYFGLHFDILRPKTVPYTLIF